MSAGKKLRRVAATEHYSGGYVHWCPACKEVHQYQTPRWNFNGDFDRPTFTPSMAIRWGRFADPNWRVDEGEKDLSGVCHYNLTEGQIQYHADSTHALAGQTVTLPDWPYDPGTYGGVED